MRKECINSKLKFIFFFITSFFHWVNFVLASQCALWRRSKQDLNRNFFHHETIICGTVNHIIRDNGPISHSVPAWRILQQSDYQVWTVLTKHISTDTATILLHKLPWWNIDEKWQKYFIERLSTG
jgi:hypothetical protein